MKGAGTCYDRYVSIIFSTGCLLMKKEDKQADSYEPVNF
jgi:hypothetical protein